MNKSELYNFFERRAIKVIGKDWQNLSAEKREGIITGFVEKNFDEISIDSVKETVKDIRDQNRDAILFIFGLLLGVLGGMIADIIQSVLLKYGAIYYIIVFVLSFVICAVFIRFVRAEKRKTFRSNKAVRNFLKEVRKEIAINKK